MAFDGETLGDARPRRTPTLSQSEKAMLFDLAMATVREHRGGDAQSDTCAALVAAFARAYVLIRDREDGII